MADTKERVDAWISSIENQYVSMWDMISQRYSCAIIQNNFEMPDYRILGNYDAVNFHGMTNIVNCYMGERRWGDGRGAGGGAGGPT